MVNKAILIGNLGSDPEVNNTTSGKQVASFSLATSERYKDRTTGEAKNITDWHKRRSVGASRRDRGQIFKEGK